MQFASPRDLIHDMRTPKEIRARSGGNAAADFLVILGLRREIGRKYTRLRW